MGSTTTAPPPGGPTDTTDSTGTTGTGTGTGTGTATAHATAPGATTPAGVPKRRRDAGSPPGGPAKRTTRKGVVRFEWVAIVVLLATVGAGAVSLMGQASSSRFESVANAICARRAASTTPLVDRGAGVLGAAAGTELACGPSPASGASNNRFESAPTSRAPASPPVAKAQVPTTVAPSAPPASTAPTSPPAAEPSTPVVPLDPNVGRGPATVGHLFVSHATLTVEVTGDGAPADIVNAKKRDAVLSASSVGGGLFGEQTSYDGDAKAVLTLKVPAEHLGAVLDSLSSLGALRHQEVKSDEVTLQAVDINARITAATDGLERAKTKLADAAPQDAGAIEIEVARRQTELEQLRGQQIMLDQQIDLATIVLTLTSPAPATATTTTAPPAAPEPELPGFSDGLSEGWKVFTNVGTVALAVVGAVLPFVPLALASYVVWRLLRRRHHRQHGPTPTAAPAPAPTPAAP